MMRWMLVLICGALVLCQTAFGAEVLFAITPDRSNAVYRCGEKATFTVSVCDSNNHAVTSGVLRVTFTRDGYELVSSNSFDMSSTSAPITVSGTLGSPGFLHCTAALTGDRWPRFLSSWSSAGFDPDKIQPATKFPSDFREWWDNERKKLFSVPLDIQLENINAISGEYASGYRISVASANGERVHGFLGVPSGKAGKTNFPALVLFPGYGGGFSGPSMGTAQTGYLTLWLNVHKYPVPANSEKAMSAFKDYDKNLASKSYLLEGRENPDKYHFYTIFLGFDRAIDYLLSRPEWDQKNLIVEGASQGGWLALVMAGMKNDKVTAAVAQVPFMGDLERKYWHSGTSLNNGLIEKGSMTIPYYAGVNFARFIKCPVIVSVGYRDGSCYPASVYAVYNVIPSADKKLYAHPQAGHGLLPEDHEAKAAFMKKWIGK
ncbi:MAG: acetylxylan esterase [Kiritimatiellia bacterium]